MARTSNLWAIGYDDMDRASQVRDEIASFGWGKGQAARYLILLDLAVVVRHPDATFTLDQQPFSGLGNILACSGAGFLAGLTVAAPLTGAAIGALLGGVGSAAGTLVGISEEFIQEVEKQMKPGTSALFVLDDAGDMEVILHKIQGLGGKVLRTNVDMERARLIQSTLASVPNQKPDA